MRISDWSSDVCSSDLRAAIVERSARQASEGATAKSDTAREQEALRQAAIAKDAHNAKQSPESNNPAGPVRSAVLERLREQQRRGTTAATRPAHMRRPEERRVGKGCAHTCKQPWSPDPTNNK